MSTETSATQVGPYRLLTRIGEGGMGVVHLGQDSDGHRVAVKVLRPHVIGDQEARERLSREVSSLRLVRSPRVAEIIDADPFGATPYVATRYVPGLSLHEHVREEGPLTGVDLMHFADCLAEALIAVHGVGVLHRDIKPSNVLMEGRSPVLIDFGLARLTEDPRLTRTGWLLGTPGYLAPEILFGEDAVPASDVHAWAATVVFAATGRPPYGKGPTMAVLDRVRRGEFDLGDVPFELSGLLSAALSPEPLQRPGIHEAHVWLRSQLDRHTADRRLIARTPPERQAEEPAYTMPLVSDRRPEQTTARPVSSPEPRVEAEPVPMASVVPAPASEPDTTDIPADPAPRDQAVAARRDDDAATRVIGPPVEALGPPRPHRGQTRAQLAGLIAATSGLVAYAPYLGTLLVTLAVLLLRTASVTRQRHWRRQDLRGRPRWYDVPTTTLSTPGYVALALVGTVAAVGWGIGAAVAVGVIAFVAGASVAPGLTIMGLVFTFALWWGPGSSRIREVTSGLVRRTSRGGWPGWFVAGCGLVLGASLLAALFSTGPDWAPTAQAPWATGFLAEVRQYL